MSHVNVNGGHHRRPRALGLSTRWSTPILKCGAIQLRAGQTVGPSQGLGGFLCACPISHGRGSYLSTAAARAGSVGIRPQGHKVVFCGISFACEVRIAHVRRNFSSVSRPTFWDSCGRAGWDGMGWCRTEELEFTYSSERSGHEACDVQCQCSSVEHIPHPNVPPLEHRTCARVYCILPLVRCDP